MAGKRIPQHESNRRIDTCYNLRFKTEPPTLHKDWIKYCKENYGDKSELTYTYYWSKAGDIYKDTWKEKLNRHIDPAVDQLIRLLTDNDPRVRDAAIAKIFKYTGNDVDKQEIKGMLQTIQVGFSKAQENTNTDKDFQEEE